MPEQIPPDQPSLHGVHQERDYSAAELEYLRAIDRWRSKHRRVPALLEGFRIARELGYRRVDR